MNTNFKIGNDIISVDIFATREFYLTQNEITVDCKCSDCNYYCDSFICEQFEILDTFRKMGIDLRKNLKSEGTGVECVRDENGEVLFIFQVYQCKGSLKDVRKKEYEYSTVENCYRLNVKFFQSDSKTIDFELKVERA